MLLFAGLGWVITDRLLRQSFPLTWGGPNIGGGVLLLLAWLAAAGGAALVIVDFVLYHRGDRTSHRPRVGWWVAVAFTLVLSALITFVLVQPRTATTGINGQVGVTVSGDGTAVLLLEICRGSTTDVAISGPNRGSIPNEVLAHFHATSPVGSTVLLNVAHPPPGWTRQPGLPGTKVNGLQIAAGRGQQTELRQVNFSATDLAALTPGTVLYSPGHQGSAGFRKPSSVLWSANDLAVPVCRSDTRAPIEANGILVVGGLRTWLGSPSDVRLTATYRSCMAIVGLVRST